MNRPSNILPFPVDYAPNLYDSLEERERIDRIIADIRKDALVMRAQAAVKWFCIASAVFAMFYFLLRGAF